MRVAYFQEAHPSRNVIQKRAWQDRNPNFLELKCVSADGTVFQEKQTRHTKSSTKSMGSNTRAQIVLRRQVSDRRNDDIQAQAYHVVEEQDVFCRQRCFFAHDGRKLSLSFLPQEKKNPYDRPQTTWSSKPGAESRSTQEARVHMQDLGTHLYVKLEEDSPSVLYLGR